jgi:hypothetical protein
MTGLRARLEGSSVAALVGLLLLPTACKSELTSPGQAPTDGSFPSTHASPFTPDVRAARWWLTFDDTGLSYEGIREFDDAARFNHQGRVELAGAGRLERTPGPVGRGDAVLFPPICTPQPDCGMAMVVVKDSFRLDPEEADFAFGASIKLTPEQTTTGSNIMQKGRYGATGGQWKLQVDTLDGKPSCVVRGASELLSVRSPVSLTDGQWHRVTCLKDSSGVQIDVDGATRRQSGAVGPVSNDYEIRVGSSGVTAGDDQFHGALDDVFLIIAETQVE